MLNHQCYANNYIWKFINVEAAAQKAWRVELTWMASNCDLLRLFMRLSIRGLGTFQAPSSWLSFCEFSQADNIKSLKGREETDCNATYSRMIVDKLQTWHMNHVRNFSNIVKLLRNFNCGLGCTTNYNMYRRKQQPLVRLWKVLIQKCAVSICTIAKSKNWFHINAWYFSIHSSAHKNVPSLNRCVIGQ